MAHGSKRCQRIQCTDKHPFHLHNGKILRSVRQSEGGPLMDTKEASELIDPKFREVRNVVSQNDFDIIFQAGRQDGLREGHLKGSALGWTAGYQMGEQTARESAARLF